ncbi:MAG: hypothetical protein JWN15_1516 [Firmicutes bacterium]|nr:hypothetical protein [Bacillota bacterium]
MKPNEHHLHPAPRQEILQVRDVQPLGIHRNVYSECISE